MLLNKIRKTPLVMSGIVGLFDAAVATGIASLFTTSSVVFTIVFGVTFIITFFVFLMMLALANAAAIADEASGTR